MKKLDTIKLVIFDLDGTLVNAYPAIYASFNHVMRTLGYPVQPEGVIRRAVGWGDRRLIEPFVKASDVDAALASYRRHHAKSLLSASSVLPGVKSMLATLDKRGYRMAVATNRPTRFSNILLRHLGLKRFISAVLCADKLSKGKPDPEILLSLIRRFSVSARETVYVGDMLIDAETGSRAKVRTVLVTTGSGTAKELRSAGAFATIKTAALLPRFLKGRA